MNQPRTHKQKVYCQQLDKKIDMYYSTIEHESKQYFYLLGCDHENGSAECTDCKTLFKKEQMSK